MLGRELTRRVAQAAFLAVALLGPAACNGAFEGEGERINRGVKDDVRGTRDFLRDRGITIDTRLPER
jgi:hypothetical protein